LSDWQHKDVFSLSSLGQNLEVNNVWANGIPKPGGFGNIKKDLKIFYTLVSSQSSYCGDTYWDVCAVLVTRSFCVNVCSTYFSPEVMPLIYSMETTADTNNTIALFDSTNSQLQNAVFQHSHHY